MAPLPVESGGQVASSSLASVSPPGMEALSDNSTRVGFGGVNAHRVLRTGPGIWAGATPRKPLPFLCGDARPSRLLCPHGTARGCRASLGDADDSTSWEGPRETPSALSILAGPPPPPRKVGFCGRGVWYVAGAIRCVFMCPISLSKMSSLGLNFWGPEAHYVLRFLQRGSTAEGLGGWTNPI